MNLRNLSEIEIQQLTAQGNFAENWADVIVAPNFSTKKICNCTFWGKIKIRESVTLLNSNICNCDIFDGVAIANVYHLGNYVIESNAVLENCNEIETTEESSFGEGTMVALLDETGSRTIPIYCELTAQIAHLLTFWKVFANKKVEKLTDLILSDIEKRKSNIGVIAKGAKLKHCGIIRNVRVGEYATIEGASCLKNGTIKSSFEAQTVVGNDVIACDFILEKGVSITDAAQLERCFIGVNTKIGKQFSAIDTIAFANCEFFHGEATALLAGPATVSHHKCTLLIAMQTQFFNAGSGSNESNHMYKRGPIHYGILERGTKMASDSYIPFPSIIGAFSLILGKHKNKIDTTILPFSYVVADGRKARIIPGRTLRNFGTYRDVRKWKLRDKRTESQRQDIINYDFLNPFVIGEVIDGIEFLETNLKENTEVINLSDKVYILRKDAEFALKLYKIAILEFLSKNISCAINETEKSEKWLDICGLVVRKEDIENLLKNVVTVDDLNNQIQQLENSYNLKKQAFANSLVLDYLNVSTVNKDVIENLKIQSEKEKEYLLKLIVEDAQKESKNEFVQLFGYGQNSEEKESEIASLRGEMTIDEVRKIVENKD